MNAVRATHSSPELCVALSDTGYPPGVGVEPRTCGVEPSRSVHVEAGPDNVTPDGSSLERGVEPAAARTSAARCSAYELRELRRSMPFRLRFRNGLSKLLADDSICGENRALFAQFFEWLEYKLKRRQGLATLDEPCYRTLYGYILKLRNVNRWFTNRPWSTLSRADIQQVYDDLEEGRIRTARGPPFRDLAGYYAKVFKGKPFTLAGKSDLARQVIEVTRYRRTPVQFLTEDGFRQLIAAVPHKHHRLLLWLAWDIGENVGALLQLRKSHFTCGANPTTGEREYLVRLEAALLKRSRQARTEVTLYSETTALLDDFLPHLQDDEPLFHMRYESARKCLRLAVVHTGVTSLPQGNAPRLKDLRSGMACHLLRHGWTRDEVNARLGHTPHSDALDAYINLMALDRNQAKMRLASGRAAESTPSASGWTAHQTLLPRHHPPREGGPDAEMKADPQQLAEMLAETRAQLIVLEKQLSDLVSSGAAAGRVDESNQSPAERRAPSAREQRPL